VGLSATALLDQIAALPPLRKQAKQRLVAQARQHPDDSMLMKLPVGSMRVAQLLALVGTPQRFRTKR